MHLDNVGAVILAGGRATRMGGEDKGLVCLKGKPLVCRAAEKLMPVCAHVVVSANRNLAAYRALGLTVVTDSLENFPGPLAGWLSAMDALTTDYVVSIPCDVPFFPADMVEKLYAALVARPDKACAAVRAGGFPQPTAAMMRRTAAVRSLSTLQRGSTACGGGLRARAASGLILGICKPLPTSIRQRNLRPRINFLCKRCGRNTTLGKEGEKRKSGP